VLASLGYHDYEGVAFRDDEKPRLQKDLGMARHLVLRNHGLLTVGTTIADAFLNMYRFESTCQIQVSAQAGGELIRFAEEIYTGADRAAVYVREGGRGGLFVWPALLRKLDRVDTSYKN
jgi:ribulose-5-phosphate 4-epimerase/fuculose-1-phosphate aldolase